MVAVVFFEKQGCAGNARQKALLQASGHAVEAHDLRDTPWDAPRLLAFLGGIPVAEWFNRSAPALKSGAIVPEGLAPEAALKLLCAEPLLIRRPLLQVGDERRVGFDAAAIDAWIGLAEVPAENLESCRHTVAEEPVFYVHSASGGAMACRFKRGEPHAGRCSP